MASPIDKYAHDAGSKSPAWDDLPPDPAAPMLGADAVLQLYAPKDDTMLDLGAGKRSGIRMVTDAHVHLTARSPRTTISLGAPGGDGINDAALGLQIYTEAEKRETIDGPTEEWYKNKKTEFVKGVWTERCEASKTEHVIGRWDQTCNDEKTETIAKAVTQSYGATHKLTVEKEASHAFKGGKVEHVTGGDMVTEVSQNKRETIHGDWIVHVDGARHFEIDSDHVHTNNGDYVTSNKGSTSTTTEGTTLSNTRTNISIVRGVKAERSSFKVDVSGIRTQQVAVDVCSSTILIINADVSLFAQ